MQSRLLAGWRGLLLAAAVASLVLLPLQSAYAGKGPTAAVGSHDSGFSAATDENPIKARVVYPRSNYQWPFATGPMYGTVDPSEWSTPGVLHFAVGSFDTNRGTPNFPAELKTAIRLERGAQHFVLAVDPVSFNDGSFDKLRDAITGAGGAIVEEMANGGFIVRLTQGAFGAVQGQHGVMYLEPYHPAYKLAPTVGRVPLPDPVKALSNVYTLEVQLFAGEEATAVAQAIAGMGGNVLSIWPGLVRVEINRDKLAEIAALEPVRMVFEALPNYPQAEETTTTLQTGKWNGGAIPYHDAGIKGAGQVLMVLDTGLQLDAGDLSNTRASAGAAGTAHRKVRNYTTTGGFGGSGDLLGCDNPQQGGVTHGHIVSATALGNGTAVPTGYGASWYATDLDTGQQWKLDGVAPLAKVVMYDGNTTPSVLSCSDPFAAGIAAGDLYAGPSGGSLGDAYVNYGARVVNFSWGQDGNPTYGTNAADIDTFMYDKGDALVFVSAGNSAQDLDNNSVPDTGSISDPATCKNCVPVGASYNANDTGTDNTSFRAGFSSVGPATATSLRVAPLLMAPGTDTLAGMGIPSEYACRSNDNDQADPVQCDIAQFQTGTSFASPAAAGAALLVRDYFAQGFYPDGTSTNAQNSNDLVSNISAALTKAVLIASADFMDANGSTESATTTIRYRFNWEQGYGRIQLNNALPLTTYASPTGLIVADGGIAGGKNNTTLSGTASSNSTETYTFTISDTSQELKVALAWIEASGETLSHDLDLELVSPASARAYPYGITYWGNYFTDDDNKNGLPNAGEDCAVPGSNQLEGVIDNSRFSQPTCANSDRDTRNPTEAIFLSPDPNGDGNTADSQIVAGTWTLRVIGRTMASAQPYALAIAGPVQLGSSARLRVVRDGVVVTGEPACNDSVQVVVNEFDEATDPAAGLTASEIASRTTVQVWNGATLVDYESGLTFTQTGTTLNYTSNAILLTDGTAPDPGNGVLDVQHGYTLRVVYADETTGVPDSNKERRSTLNVNCRAQVNFGGVTFGLFGRDFSAFANGGCERDARGLFTFGYPDIYFDAGESIDYRIALQTSDSSDLVDAEASLRAVYADANSPNAPNCKPGMPPPGGSDPCTDPDRTSNTAVPTSILQILDSPKWIGTIPAQVAYSESSTAAPVVVVNFTIQMGSDTTGPQEFDMLLSVTAKKAGKTVGSLAASRHVLNADELSLWYSTDFPTGGSALYDWNNNETLEQPTTFLGDVNWEDDYRFERYDNTTSHPLVWGDLTAGGTKNANLRAPWNFDTNNGGFTSGLEIGTNPNIATTIALWGEDKNFNDTLDSGEDRDPVNGSLDQNWSTRGGCGWQTRAGGAGTPGGVWHTGRIDATGLANCLVSGATAGECQRYEVYPGTTAQSYWMEVLETPVIEKVNGSAYRVEFTNWAWNMALDLSDSFGYFLYEFDTDTTSINPVTLEADLAILNFLGGAYGTVSGGNSPLTDGYPVFADFVNSGASASKNGTIGGNHQGQNPCYFEDFASRYTPYGFARPLDDDLRNGWCDNLINPADKQTRCTVATQAADCPAPTYHGVCTLDGTTTTDQFVYANGPLRNMNVRKNNGIDLRVNTFEDLYGDSGTTFQGGFGFANFEGDTSKQPAAGFGASLDDVVVEWREISQTADATTCTGQCATLDMQTSQFFQGLASLDLTVMDPYPSIADCNHNDSDLVCSNNTSRACRTDADCVTPGTCNTTDPGDAYDCDGNSIDDVVVKVVSAQEVAGEYVTLNQVSGSNRYTGKLPISSAYNSAGTLFVQRQGTEQPYALATFYDNDDGSGAPCGSDPDPTKRGLVQAQVSIYLPAGKIVVKGTRVTNDSGYGDDDSFADARETVKMYVTVSNKTGIDLTNVVARLATNDADIACITKPVLNVGSLAKAATAETTDYFVFKVADAVNRTAVNQDVSAKFSITLSGDQFDTTVAPQEVTLDLDLNVTGGSGPTNFAESFEVGSGYNQFVSQSLDLGKSTNALSNGYRCQYNDPDFPNSNSYGETECYVGMVNTAYNAYDWHIHRTTSPDGGRAYVGTMSLHWGYHQTNPDNDTTRLSQLDAIRLNNAVNLGYMPVTSGQPELSFKHQASLMDYRTVNADAGEAPDRGMVALQLSSGGTGFGNWNKLYPYENVYDVQASNNYINCTFDPIDDGNNEDSYFDPTDPYRQYGPSSTCFPEFNFSSVGDSDYRKAFTPGNVQRASDDKVGLRGSINRGTWVTSRFDLSRFRGQQARIRFLVTTIKVSDLPFTFLLGFPNKNPLDDGWYIDDVQISNTLTTAATVAVDTNATTYPACPANCSTITASLVATPSTLPAPGQVTELSALASAANACIGGVLQYQWWIDNDADGVVGETGETLLRDWSEDGVYIDAPSASTQYGVKARCTSATSCVGSATALVTVNCPSTGNLSTPFTQVTTFSNKTTYGWAAAANVDAIRGDLIALRTNRSFANGTVLACTANNQTISSVTVSETPSAGGGYYLLVRPAAATYCNQRGLYSGQTAKEDPGRDTEIDTNNPSKCP